MDSSTSNCSCGSQSWQSYSQLKHILPLHYNYQVCSFNELPDSAFHAILRMPVTTEEDMRLWIKEFEEMTKVTFRVTRTYPRVGLKNVFRETYHCQHSGRRNNEKGRKNTACKATLGVTVKRCLKRSKAKRKDGHLPFFPTIVDLHWEHNHNLNSAAVLQLRDVSDLTKDVFLNLFEEGHTPSSAMKLYKSNIHLSSGEEYVYLAADRSVVPDAQSIYRLYQKQFTDLNGNQGAQNIDQRIPDMVDGLINKDCNAPLRSATVTSNELGEEQQELELEMSVEDESSNINVIDRTDDVLLDLSVSNEIDSPTDAQLLDKFQKIDDFATIIKELLQTDRQYYEPAVDMFLRSVQKIKTHSHWFSSLCSFGKYSGCPSKGKLTTLTKRIGIQRTAIARRKHKLRGRNIVRAGRPTKKF